MASYSSINGYSAASRVPAFYGLMQYGDGLNADPRYSPEAVNAETLGGVLQPAAACELLPPTLPAPIRTLAMLHRRWHADGEGSKNLLIAASAGRLYAMEPDAQDWTALPFPEGVSAYQSDDWSYVSYEINPEGSAAPVDVLLLSNALDGMVMVRGDTLAVARVPTPRKFGVIARHAERIWGGAITEDPDMLVYSAPYDPTNWEANTDIPEDGAGDIQQPSWDGDSFTALHPFGSQLIAFKRTRVWRILGLNPGEYTFKEQYGGGAPFYETIAVDGERIFMLSSDGVDVYDGTAVTPFQHEYCKQVFARMNILRLNKAAACVHNHKYHLALPLDGAEANNAVLTYDTQEGSWLLRDDVRVEAFLPTEDALYFTSAETPGQVWKWQEDSWSTGVPTASPVRWCTPWNDLTQPNMRKNCFEVYFLPEARSGPVTVRLSIQTEKRIKTKEYIVSAGGGAQTNKRLRFSNTGRRFRVIIEADGQQGPWRLCGGLLILSEVDAD